MKKIVIALTMLLALGTTAQTAAQKHRHHAVTVQTADTVAQESNEIEAFSDTTDTDTTSTVMLTGQHHGPVQLAVSLDDTVTPMNELKELLRHADIEGIAGMLMVLGIVFIVFVLSPLAVLLALFLLLRRNRKDKLRMAEMAVKNGQPIPEELLKDTPQSADSNDVLWQKGIRQTFLGIGLMAFMGYTAGHMGFGIGVLVTLIGLGKLVIVKTSERRSAPMADDRDYREQ